MATVYSVHADSAERGEIRFAWPAGEWRDVTIEIAPPAGGAVTGTPTVTVAPAASGVEINTISVVGDAVTFTVETASDTPAGFFGLRLFAELSDYNSIVVPMTLDLTALA